MADPPSGRKRAVENGGGRPFSARGRTARVPRRTARPLLAQDLVARAAAPLVDADLLVALGAALEAVALNLLFARSQRHGGVLRNKPRAQGGLAVTGMIDTAER